MIEELKKTFQQFNNVFSKTELQKKKRTKEFTKFLESGFPTKKLEDWKFSDFNRIISNNFKSLNINLNQKIEFNFNNYVKEFKHNKIVLFNGFYHEHSFQYEDEKEINFTDFKKDTHEQFDSIISTSLNNSLNSLNNAFYTDGVKVFIQKGYIFNKPLIIYNVFKTNNQINFFNQKFIFSTRENSKIDIILYNINLGSVPIFINTNNSFFLEKNSSLKLYRLNELNNNDIFYNSSNIDVKNNAIFENFILSYSSNFFKNDIKCNLNDDHSSAFINGANLNNLNQHHEIKSYIKHTGKNTKSYQKIKSVLDKNSKSVFQGKIFVEPQAQKTDGYQLSKAILLDNESEFDSKPELEIYADDVKCSHGSTSGSLAEDAIFYLMSRGLNKFEAKKLLIQGFLSDAIETITNDKIKKYFLNKIEKKIDEYR